MVLKFEANRLLFLKIVQQGKRETLFMNFTYKNQSVFRKKDTKEEIHRFVVVRFLKFCF